MENNAYIPATLVPPDGSNMIELKPDTGYVVQFNRPVSQQEAYDICNLFGSLSVQGLCGPVVILSMGVDISVLRDGYKPLVEKEGDTKDA